MENYKYKGDKKEEINLKATANIKLVGWLPYRDVE